MYTFSSCGGNDAVVPASEGIFLPDQIPPGVLRQIPFQVYECCGNCTLDVSEVRLYYFRDVMGNSSDCQANQTLRSQTTSSAASNEKRGNAISAGSSIAIVSGYTFTSPSLYLEIVGTAAVSDSCAPLGAVHTNPIVALPPGVLMTYSPQFPFTVGQKYSDPNGVIGGQFLGFKKPLNIAELECPTFGVGLATSADGRVYRTYGPPYLPIIIPPLQILSLDPAWEKYCRGYVSYSPGLRSFGIFDPPRILSPVAALLPPSPSAPAIAPASRTPDPVSAKESQVQPARKTSPSIPMATIAPVAPGLPPPGSKPSLSVIAGESSPIDDEKPGSKAPQLPAQRATAPIDPEIFSNAEPALIPPPSGPEQIADPKEESQGLGAIIYSAFDRGDSLTGKSANQVSALPVPRPDAHEFTADGQKVTIVDPSDIAVGGNTYSAGGVAATLPNGVLSIIAPAEDRNGGARIDGTHPIVKPLIPKILTIAGQTFTANPSEVAIAGTTLLPGGSGIAISGTPISLAPSGTLFLGGSPVPLANDLSSPPSFVFTIGGHTVTANPAGFVLAGSELVPGGTQITISGTPVSLNPSGLLFIGSSSTNLFAPPSSPSTFTAGGHTFTADSTGFELDGSTLLPGGAAITVSGTRISLAPSGILIMGSSSIDLPFKPLASDVFTAGGLTFTAESSAVVVDGTTLVPGGPAATISGTPISLKAGKDSEILIIGTSTVNLPAHTAASRIFTFGGLTFTAQPSGVGVVVDGSTLVPGGSGLTISGTPVSLEPGGRSLVVGSRVVPLATSSPTTGGSVTLLGFEGGQARCAEMPSFWRVASLLGIGCMVFMLGGW